MHSAIRDTPDANDSGKISDNSLIYSKIYRKMYSNSTINSIELLRQSIGSLRGHLPFLMAHQALGGEEASILYSSERWEGRIRNGNCFLLLGVRQESGSRPAHPLISSESQPAEAADQ